MPSSPPSNNLGNDDSFFTWICPPSDDFTSVSRETFTAEPSTSLNETVYPLPRSPLSIPVTSPYACNGRPLAHSDPIPIPVPTLRDQIEGLRPDNYWKYNCTAISTSSSVYPPSARVEAESYVIEPGPPPDVVSARRKQARRQLDLDLQFRLKKYQAENNIRHTNLDS